MNILLCILYHILISIASSSITQITQLGFQTRNSLSYNTFQDLYSKRYSNDAQRFFRTQVYAHNKKKIIDHNSRPNANYKLGVNKFADLTQRQFIARYGGLLPWQQKIQKYIDQKAQLKRLEQKQCLCDNSQNFRIQQLKRQLVNNNILVQRASEVIAERININQQLNKITNRNSFFKQIGTFADYTQSTKNLNNQELPRLSTLFIQNNQIFDSDSTKTIQPNTDSYTQSIQQSNDWTSNVGPVIEQGSCGSCYAAATVQTVQGIYSIYSFGGAHLAFSVQQIVDCSNQAFDGCLGGWLQTSFQFIKDNGVNSHFQYPYNSGVTGSSQTCQQNTGTFKVSSYVTIQNSCSQIINLLASRPVAAGVAGTKLQFYSSGVYNGCVDSQIIVDHAIIIVGYNSGIGYKIKNSWGTDWGQNGYAWLTTDPTKNCGLCRIASTAFLDNE